MYTKDSLAEINSVYLSFHAPIEDSDVENANKWVRIIEASRDDSRPLVGDIVHYTNEYSDYYAHAHIDEISLESAVVCECPFVPFVGWTEKDGLSCSKGGGAYERIDLRKLTYVGKEEKLFKDWGSCGGCAYGSITFAAEVNVWEYTPENLRFGPYTTKDWVRAFIYFGEKDKDSNHINFGDCRTFSSEMGYMAWLLTYKGVEFEGYSDKETVVFFYQREEYLISKEAWDILALPVDTRPIGMQLQYIKYKYNDNEHVITEYRFSNVGDSNIRWPYQAAREKIRSGEVQRVILKPFGE